MDRLPTARIVEKLEDIYYRSSEVYGKGIIMWILSQGKNMKVMYPPELVEQIISEINEIQQAYKIVYI